MIEIAAAAVGAAFSAVVMAVSGAGRRASEGRDAVIRLTAAVENVANRLEELHVDIKADRRETYGRLNAIEQRVAKLEANS
jgi:hypothetical protein